MHQQHHAWAEAAQGIVAREFAPQEVLAQAACDYAAAEHVAASLAQLPGSPEVGLDAHIAWQTLQALQRVLSEELEADRAFVDAHWADADGDETWRESLTSADLDASLDEIVRRSALPDDEVDESELPRPVVRRDRFTIPDEVPATLPDLTGLQPKHVYEAVVPHYVRSVVQACLGSEAFPPARLQPLLQGGVVSYPALAALCVSVRELARQLRYPLDSDEADGAYA
jgi:hypothetical protein